MAYTKITFENPANGYIKEAPVGFSWTVLFFGVFPPLFRSDWKWAAIILLLALITWGLSNIVMAFLYNKFFIKDLLNTGYKVKSVETGTVRSVSGKLGLQLPQLETIS